MIGYVGAMSDLFSELLNLLLSFYVKTVKSPSLFKEFCEKIR